MGLLDSVIGGLLGGSNTSSGMGGVLANLLGGRRDDRDQPQGGLHGLLSAFENAGMGNIAQSWVSTGPNQPVTPDQLHRVFGHERVNQMADQAGMEPQSFLSQLSEHLPNAVDRLTPQGRVPDEGTISV
jgi:uncharacterized protein YidB (DUF937 family)